MAEIQNIIELTFTEADGSAFAASALESATNAAESASNALRYANTAGDYAESASEFSESASNSAGAAQQFANTANDSMESAQEASNRAAASAQQAASSATTAESARDNAFAHMTRASEFATNASTSATSASRSATNAGRSATNATNMAINASNSATSASDSATSASASAASANTAKNNAEASATAAASSASTAQTQAQNAMTHASNAQTFANNAQTSATQAAASATTANDSANLAVEVAESIPADYTDLSNDVSQITEKMELVVSKNLYNPDNTETGMVTANGTKYDNYTNYRRMIKPIPVEEGDVLRFYARTSVAPFMIGNARWLCAYDSEMNAVESAGYNSMVNSYTVPSGIAYVNPSFETNFDVLVTKNYVATSFIEYEQPYYVAGNGFHADISMDETDFDDIYLDYSMVNRLDPAECQVEKSINARGVIGDNSAYFISDYMPIRKDETLRGFAKDDLLLTYEFRMFAAFDVNKNLIESLGSNYSTNTITQSGEMAYVRVSMAYRSSDAHFQPSNIMVVATPTPTKAVDYNNNPVFKSKYIPSDNSVSLHVYLPPEICVGIGRTIELYNNLVCLEANKYHLRYSCSVGIQYARKYSITGATAGSYTLTLQIYDDDLNLLWNGTSTVKVVANNISVQKKIIPIGDSLTNLKPWLSEVQTLSNDKILYIGTRGRSDIAIRHEGRSGFSAGNYNSNAEYTFDSYYQGNPNVSGEVNPFWDATNEKFSLNYYNTQQAETVGTADAVSIFLGTNDIALDPTDNVANIVELVDNIQSEYPNMPIFVCNTIYRSNQNGYYSTGGQGYTSASDWAYNADMKIMNLQNALSEALNGYSNVYIIPLSVCMDRDYDFGQVAVAVNPRLQDVTVNIPSESVHPQNAGYMQIADVMYSAYIAHLS